LTRSYLEVAVEGLKPSVRTFELLQGCNSHKVAVTWQEMSSCHSKWPEVTRKWRHLPGSHLEVAVEGL